MSVASDVLRIEILFRTVVWELRRRCSNRLRALLVFIWPLHSYVVKGGVLRLCVLRGAPCGSHYAIPYRVFRPHVDYAWPVAVRAWPPPSFTSFCFSPRSGAFFSYFSFAGYLCIVLHPVMLPICVVLPCYLHFVLVLNNGSLSWSSTLALMRCSS